MYWNSSPDFRIVATLVFAMSSGAKIGPPIDPAISSPVSSSVTTRPSARVNTERWDRSQRANAPLIASARSMNVCEGPTAKIRPGHGQRS